MNFDTGEEYDRWLEEKQQQQILKDSVEIKEESKKWWTSK